MTNRNDSDTHFFRLFSFGVFDSINLNRFGFLSLAGHVVICFLFYFFLQGCSHKEVDPLWQETQKRMCELACISHILSIDAVTIRSHENRKFRIQALLQYNYPAKTYSYISGTMNGDRVGAEYKEMKELIDPLNTRTEEKTVHAVRNGNKKVISGTETQAFDYKMELVDSDSNEYKGTAEGTAWVDPISKTILSSETKYYPKFFSIQRIFFEKAEARNEYTYSKSRKLIRMETESLIHLKFAFIESIFKSKKVRTF